MTVRRIALLLTIALVACTSPEPSAGVTTTTNQSPGSTTSTTTSTSSTSTTSMIPTATTTESSEGELDLRDGETEIYRTEVAGSTVSIVHFVASDGVTTFLVEGAGDTSSGGAFPGEIWNGCYQVQHRDAGYTAIVVDDPSWVVTVDGEPVPLEEAGDFGVAVIPEVVDNPDIFEVTTADGAVPACVAG